MTNPTLGLNLWPQNTNSLRDLIFFDNLLRMVLLGLDSISHPSLPFKTSIVHSQVTLIGYYIAVYHGDAPPKVKGMLPSFPIPQGLGDSLGNISPRPLFTETQGNAQRTSQWGGGLLGVPSQKRRTPRRLHMIFIFFRNLKTNINAWFGCCAIGHSWEWLRLR